MPAAARACPPSKHKTGGEFPAAVVPLHHAMPKPLLSRALLYTAVTRAKRQLILIGTERALAACVANDAEDVRRDSLRERLEMLADEAGLERIPPRLFRGEETADEAGGAIMLDALPPPPPAAAPRALPPPQAAAAAAPAAMDAAVAAAAAAAAAAAKPKASKVPKVPKEPKAAKAPRAAAKAPKAP